jgi:hypothetical protein
LNALVIRPVSVLTQVVQAGAFVNRSSSHWIYAQDGEVALVVDDTAPMIGWIILARLSFRPRPKTLGGSNTLAGIPTLCALSGSGMIAVLPSRSAPWLMKISLSKLRTALV